MSDQKIEDLSPETFPFPKIAQAFNYFFPKEKGASDIFTMENLRRFSRIAPYLALAILGLILVSWIRDSIYAYDPACKNPAAKWGIYLLFDTLIFVIAFFRYLWWIGTALFAKFLRRSPAIPLTMSFVDLLKLLGGLCFLHFMGFLMGGLIDSQSSFFK